MLSTDPHPVQLACMAADTVVELVRFLGMQLQKMLRTKDPVKAARVGAWVWAVLGKCQDRGELASEEIADLRELAQLALRLQNGGQGTTVDDEGEGNEDGSVDDGISAGDDAIVTPASNINGEASDQQHERGVNRQKLLSATLDMIVTVVGEVYGQRDLLDLRTRWPDEDCDETNLR
jgi:regulator of vacuolar morphogenesis